MMRGSGQEMDVRGELSKFDPEKYILLENLRLRARGNKIKVPCLLLSVHGIFIIDIKNFGGRIRGNDTSKHWVSRIGRKFQRFPNPALQESASEATVKYLLKNYGNIPCFCVSVFANSADFTELEARYAAFRLSHLYTYIESYQHTYFTVAQIQSMALKMWDVDSTPLWRRKKRWIRQAEILQNEQQLHPREAIGKRQG